ncbi:MAG: hypothetical protein EXX96DRAFT_21304 [Benjaminiella poitrasii]|nr:MAG: hypothetical protein EXX96DRAFT_21304 [Benjaminiella poitrasii]
MTAKELEGGKESSHVLGSVQKHFDSMTSKFRTAKKDSSEEEDRAEMASYREEQSGSMIQNPTAMAVFFLLVVETIAIIVMQSFIIYYHTTIFVQCDFTLQTLGLSQLDLIYHAIFIATPIYQIFLYLDALRQRNVFQLFTLAIFGKKRRKRYSSKLNLSSLLGFIMVVFTGIQTIQHITFEQVGCNFPTMETPNVTNTTAANNSTVDLSNTLQMSVIIYNRSDTSLFQDTLDETISNMKPLEYAILALVPLCFILMAGGLLKLYTFFRWTEYLNHTFKETRLRTTLIAWAVFSGLLKIDLFFLSIFAVQLVPAKMVGYTVPAFEGPLVFFFSLLAFLIAIHAARHEHVLTLWLFTLALVASVGYFGYRLFIFGIPRDTTHDPYMLTRYNLLFTTLTNTLLIIMTLCTCLVCIKNVSYHKVKITQDFHCICPTCYAHSSLVNPHNDQSKPSIIAD